MDIDIEAIRAAFWRATKVDIAHLEPDEIHTLLEVLPLTIVALHRLYLMPSEDAEDAEDAPTNYQALRDFSGALNHLDD